MVHIDPIKEPLQPFPITPRELPKSPSPLSELPKQLKAEPLLEPKNSLSSQQSPLADDIFGGRSQISYREFKRKLEGKYASPEIRKELSKELHIANPWDPRVSAQIEKMKETMKDFSRDGFINRHEAEKSLGHLHGGMDRYWEEKHHVQERLADNKITRGEIKERGREKIRHSFLERLFGLHKK